MTLNELRYILAVARERHFGRAAESCHVSQPSLSVAVKKLEDELQVKIFERRSNEVTLTPTGAAIMASSMARPGRVTVSLRKSITAFPWSGSTYCFCFT